MREGRLIELAQQAGFDHTGILNTDALVLRPEVRDMCASGTCRRYGHCWTCPPGCGSLEYLQQKISKFTGGILVQTTEKLKNDFDVKTMLAAEKKQRPLCRSVPTGQNYFSRIHAYVSRILYHLPEMHLS